MKFKPSYLIDSHQHAFWRGRDARGLIEDMDGHGISLAWLLTWEIAPEEDSPWDYGFLNPEHRRADGTHPGIPLSDLLRARELAPERFLVGYCPHPLKGNAPALLEAAVKMHGVRVCGEWKFRVLFDDPRCIELFRAAGEMHLPVVLHLDVPYLAGKDGAPPIYQPNWYGGTVENLERALQACPQTNFIGHAPGFWREISADADAAPEPYPDGPVHAPGRLHRLLENHPNLYADLSANSALRALKRDSRHAVEFIETHREKLLFGRDIYGTALRDYLATLDLSAETEEYISHRNARRLVPV